jgi:predicted ATPase
MPHKISIKNLGPIKQIDNLEIKKVNLVIGESASGKSVLAKVIALFNDTDSFLSSFFVQPSRARKSQAHFSTFSRELLINDFFPEYNNYSIHYFYTEDNSIKITKKKEGINIVLSDSLTKKIKNVDNQIKEIQKNQKIQDLLEEFREEPLQDMLEQLKNLSEELESLSSTTLVKKDFFKQLNILPTIFIPATRSFVSDFDDLRLSRLNRMPYARIRAGDITLRLFSETYRQFLRRFTTFSASEYNTLMKGEVERNKDQEDVSLSIRDQNKQRMDIAQWSSGQKEVFPILLILNSIIESPEEPYLLIIEEPESHLFPKDQRAIFDTIIESINLSNSKVFITTHSPYMLMSANNLMEARRRKVEKYLHKFIDDNEINASKISQGKTTSLIDKETQLIDGEYIESIADDICDEYDKIIHSDE